MSFVKTLHNRICRPFAGGTRRAEKPRQLLTRLQVEALESREVLNAALPLDGAVDNNAGIVDTGVTTLLFFGNVDACTSECAMLTASDTTDGSLPMLNLLLCPEDDPYVTRSAAESVGTFSDVDTDVHQRSTRGIHILLGDASVRYV